MSDDRNFRIPEMEYLRESLTRAAAGRVAPVPRRSRRRGLALALAGAVAVIAGALLAANPYGQKIGLDEALAKVAAKIQLSDDAPADQFTYTSVSIENAEFVASGVDRLGQEVDADFYVFKQRKGKTWVSREKQGATHFHESEPRFLNDSDRAVGLQIIAASKRADEMAETPEGRRELRRLRKPHLTGRPVLHPQFGEMPFFFIEIQQRQDEHGKLNPDGDFHLGPMTLTSSEVEEFPRTPRAAFDRVHDHMLRAEERMRGGAQAAIDDVFIPDADQMTFDALTSGAGFFTDVLPADLRATFVRALSFVPGVDVVGEVKDSRGRDGIAFERQMGDLVKCVIFDAQTSVVIELYDTFVGQPNDDAGTHRSYFRDLPKSTVVKRMVLEEARTVNEIPAEYR